MTSDEQKREGRGNKETPKTKKIETSSLQTLWRFLCPIEGLVRQPFSTNIQQRHRGIEQAKQKPGCSRGNLCQLQTDDDIRWCWLCSAALLWVLISLCFTNSVDTTFWASSTTLEHSLVLFNLYFLRVIIPTPNHYSDIVSDIPFGSIYGVFILFYSDILSDNIWHSFWHILWHFIWHSIWHLFWHTCWHLFWHTFWHIFWHSFWHSIWHLFLHSTWYLFRHSFWHSLWHMFWHCLWHSFWHMYLAHLPTSFPAF